MGQEQAHREIGISGKEIHNFSRKLGIYPKEICISAREIGISSSELGNSLPEICISFFHSSKGASAIDAYLPLGRQAPT